MIRAALAIILLVNVQLLLISPAQAVEEWRLTLGGKLQGLTFKGDNGVSGGKDFEADTTAVGLSAGLQRGSWYTGLRLSVGDYDFTDGAPDIEPIEGPSSVESVTVGRGEVDLMFGYYFWPQVSLFTGVKFISHEYQDQDYRLSYNGGSVGIAGYHPLNERWSAFGNLSVTNLNMRKEGDKLGQSNGSALEVGVIHRLSEESMIAISLHGQNQKNKFDINENQTHEIGGISFGFYHSFSY